ncbi:DUF4336 domain-containing protein [Billgrantia antri]|uniref:DUF4336 domain-containing protein n=1 Tax=Billgrantia antri TaxID=2846777 RepID=A0ABS6ZMM1_9GAMM|nr:DUF4336 domain-containing protein [Halomonas antri]
MNGVMQVAENVWIVEGPVVRWFSMPFPTRMTVVRLPDDDLFIHSPIDLTPRVAQAVESLGRPRYLVSPNTLHHLYWAQWQAAYTNTLSFAPPGLSRKRQDLAFHKELEDRPEPFWADAIDQLIFQGSRLFDEVVFFHRPSRTLIFGDLVENFDPNSLSRFHRILARLGRVLAPHGQTPLDYRQSFLLRHRQARQCLQRMLEWEPTNVIMCHGIPVQEEAEAFLENAFGWLRE